MLLKRLAQIGFAALLAFEILCWTGVLHFTLDFSWVGLVGTSVAVLLMLFYFNPQGLVWFAAFFGVALDGISDVTHMYDYWYPWDRFVHTTGGFCAGLIVFFILRDLEKRGLIRFNGAMIIPAVFVTTCTVGFFYEYWEFLVDLLYFGRPKELGDGPDTVDDMILNVLGSMIFLAVYFGGKYVIQKRRERLQKKNGN